MNGDRIASAERRRVLRVLAAIGATAWAGSAASATPFASVAIPKPIAGQDYKLVQNWTFGNVPGGTITDLPSMREAFYTRYVYGGGKLDFLNDEWQRFRDNDNHVFEDGGLSLVARAPNGVASGKLESGMLRSKWSGQYGYFECRMKVPRERGMWPAFWLNPQDGKWPPEIDILEIVNNGRDSSRNSFHFVHSGIKEDLPIASSLLNNNKTYKPGFDYADDFHTFSAEWLPGRVRHFVDDLLVVDRAYRWVHKDGSDGGPAHVLLNLAVGGKWPGDPAPDAFPTRLQASYIRVWQR